MSPTSPFIANTFYYVRITKPIILQVSILALMSISAYAQTPDPAKKTAPATGKAVKQDSTWGELINSESNAPSSSGGYGENLKPRVKRTSNKPYAPINNLFDQSEVIEIEMYTGESKVFPAPGIARVAVGNGAVLSAAALDSREVIVFANSVGVSSLFIWNADGRYQRVKINVGAGDTAKVSREISQFLATIPNTKTSVIGDNVIVEGDDLSEFDLAKIAELSKRYAGKIVNFTNRRTWEQMVFMDVKVLEFPKKLLREIGLKWGATGGAAVGGIWTPGGRGTDGPYQINVPNSPPISSPNAGPVILPSGLNILSAINLGISGQLNLSELDGKSVLLAEPQLTARSGANATFLAGGELPFTISTINGTTVQFKPYGVRLDITPTIDRNGAIRATIDTEVSSIDPGITTPSGPALLTRKTKTEFNVNNGETVVLSGFIQRNNATTYDKVPFLGDIPIIGALFRSKRFQNDETELVIFVTPTIVDARSPALVDRIEKASQKLQQKLGNPPYISEPLQPGQDPGRPNLGPPMYIPPPAISGSSGGIANSAEASTPTTSTQPATTTTSSVTYIAPQPTDSISANSSGGNSFVVTLDGLALRTKPDLNAPILRHLRNGEKVQASPQAQNGFWTAIEKDGKRGWSATQYLQPE